MTKEHILSEIRRTTAANGGNPLGKGRFFAETGIKESDWYGKYWVRWGDAVKEAGFTPNVMVTAIPDDELLRHLARLVKELGRVPLSGEVRMRARSDPTFPNEKTFRRLGTKPELFAKLHSYFMHQGERQLASLCEPIEQPIQHPDREKPAETEYGFVYLLKSGRFYKIGRSNAAGRRERELAIQLPEKAKTVHVIRTDDPAGIEEYWHRRFADRRMNGEWFDLAAGDVAAFKRRKFM